jgi:hypothetical protein
MRSLAAGNLDMTRRLATLLLVLFAACGELETPDLGHGEVAGRVTGAGPGAYAYPLGAPERKVALEADGRFRLEELPAGPLRLVLYDGGLRAEVVELVVVGAGRSVVERSAADMPLAGRLVMTVVPEGGVAPVGPRYQVRGTDQAGLVHPDGSAVLFPLPAGAYDLDTAMEGFQGATDGVAVTAGATGGVEVRLLVATSGVLGCAAVGELCRNDLRCDVGDGHCYACRLGSDDCGPGAACDPETRFCTVAPGAAAPVCSACADDAACGGEAAGAYCEKAAGAATGYCSRRGGCPAGFALDGTDPLAPRCLAILGCHTYFEEFGELCFSDLTCDEHDGIAGGFCRGADPDGGVPGACTAACTRDADCILSGFACDPVEQVCLRLAP